MSKLISSSCEETFHKVLKYVSIVALQKHCGVFLLEINVLNVWLELVTAC